MALILPLTFLGVISYSGSTRSKTQLLQRQRRIILYGEMLQNWDACVQIPVLFKKYELITDIKVLQQWWSIAGNTKITAWVQKKPWTANHEQIILWHYLNNVIPEWKTIATAFWPSSYTDQCKRKCFSKCLCVKFHFPLVTQIKMPVNNSIKYTSREMF